MTSEVYYSCCLICMPFPIFQIYNF
uniref:Uncharacterized protein n=1 Tax=Vitis vinifera TaxID=29760 RepID=F6HZW5_VITVI